MALAPGIDLRSQFDSACAWVSCRVQLHFLFSWLLLLNVVWHDWWFVYLCYWKIVYYMDVLYCFTSWWEFGPFPPVLQLWIALMWKFLGFLFNKTPKICRMSWSGVLTIQNAQEAKAGVLLWAQEFKPSMSNIVTPHFKQTNKKNPLLYELQITITQGVFCSCHRGPQTVIVSSAPRKIRPASYPISPGLERRWSTGPWDVL